MPEGKNRARNSEGRFVHLGRILPQAAGRAFRRKGFARARVFTDWADIVDRDTAENSRPARISGGTLTVVVTPSHAPTMQIQEPVILDRINTYLGTGNDPVIDRIRLKQGYVDAPQPAGRRSQRVLDAAETAHLERLVTPVQDPALRKALLDLGRAVMAAQPARTAEKGRKPEGGSGEGA
ncbi:MAG: DUF721 domain-containing protein [bacterium]|nr:DUF721 domain-containing protein [bacterium]